MTRLEKWPETQPVVFNFRMPTELQKAMLFEKLHYANDLVLGKKEAEASQRATNVDIMENKEELSWQETSGNQVNDYFLDESKCRISDCTHWLGAGITHPKAWHFFGFQTCSAH